MRYIKCTKCKNYVPNVMTTTCYDCDSICNYEAKRLINADRIRAMSDEELAEFLTHINPTNCQDCAFSYGWRCQPDRDDYSDFEKCEEGRKRWLRQPAEDDYA